MLQIAYLLAYIGADTAEHERTFAAAARGAPGFAMSQAERLAIPDFLFARFGKQSEERSSFSFKLCWRAAARAGPFCNKII